jgi:hypothetical protein
MVESSRDKLLQARKIQDAIKRERALSNVVDSATDAKRVLMKNFAQNLQYITNHSQKSMAQLVLSFKGEKDVAIKSSDAFQGLVSITNAVQIECEGYSMLGEYESSKECLIQFKKFILENKLDERDTLLRINESLEHKQIEVVDEFSDLVSRITSFDATRKIESHINDMIMDRDENEIEKVKKKPEVRTVGVRFCQRCGCELTSTNKDEHCDNCRRIVATYIRKKVSEVSLRLAVQAFINRKL